MIGFGWAVLLLSLFAPAKTFQNSYIKFAIPDNWNCAQEGTAWVCSPSSPAEAREAVIVATAKIAGPEDNLNSFISYLKQPKTLITKTKSELSQPMKVGQTRVAGLNWVEAVHLSSEIPNFMTRYLATVKDKLAVLISFSAERSSTAKYDPIFDNAIRSIQIDASQPLLLQRLEQQQAIANGPIGQKAQPLGSTPQQTRGDRNRKLVLLGLIAVATVIVLLITRKLM